MNWIRISSRYIAHERQCQDHVRYQEHQGKPDNQFDISLGSVHILLTNFQQQRLIRSHSRCKAFLAEADAGRFERRDVI
jgi:hypothetical protein